MNKKEYGILIVLAFVPILFLALPRVAQASSPTPEHPPICKVQYLEIYAVRCSDAGGDINNAVVYFKGLDVPYEVFVTKSTASIFVYLPRDTYGPSNNEYNFRWEVTDKQGNVTMGSYPS